MRLDVLASEILTGWEHVQEGQEFTISGWLAIGYAMNEARALFPGDREFGQWIAENVLGQLAQASIEPKDQQAAMWAAANADQFEEARQRGNPRTIRGIHAKWKEIEAEREAERIEAERSERAEAERAKQVAPEPETVRGSNPDQEQRTTTNPKENMVQEPVEQDESTTESCGDQEPQADPHSKPRREFRSMTPEGQEDDWVGLREEVVELRKRVKSQTSMIADLKKELRDLTGDDKAEVIRRLQASVKNAENAKWKALEDRDAYHRQVHALKKRVGELEQMGIAI